MFWVFFPKEIKLLQAFGKFWTEYWCFIHTSRFILFKCFWLSVLKLHSNISVWSGAGVRWRLRLGAAYPAFEDPPRWSHLRMHSGEQRGRDQRQRQADRLRGWDMSSTDSWGSFTSTWALTCPGAQHRAQRSCDAVSRYFIHKKTSNVVLPFYKYQLL